MSVQPNPLRVHLVDVRASGRTLTVQAACHRPGAARFTDDAAQVTCEKCRDIVRARR